MIAYKFLAEGAVAPFTGFRWRIDECVDAGPVEPCFSGIHACTVEQLPYWLGRELWEIELEGEIVRQARKLVAARGRLVRRHDGWDDESIAKRMNRRDHWNEPGGQRRAL